VLDDAGAVARTTANCGVRIAEGAHRAYVTDFIRDARAGRCAAGTPPDNLGFRLVRDEVSSWTRSPPALARRCSRESRPCTY